MPHRRGDLEDHFALPDIIFCQVDLGRSPCAQDGKELVSREPVADDREADSRFFQPGHLAQLAVIAKLGNDGISPGAISFAKLTHAVLVVVLFE